MEKITLEQRFARALVISAAGAAVGLAMIWQEPYLRSDLGIVRCAAGGAFLAGLMVARGFGGTGSWLWFRAGFFFSFATVLGFFLGIFLIPLDEILAQHDLWRYVGVTAIAPFALVDLIFEALPPGITFLLAWVGGFAAITRASRTTALPPRAIYP